MVKKKSFGPRLKACEQCGEANAPRQFFCKSCKAPFYTEEYLNSRVSSAPNASQVVSDPENTASVKEAPTEESVTAVLNAFDASKVRKILSLRTNDQLVKQQPRLVKVSGTVESDLSVAENECAGINPENAIVNTGGDCVNAIAFNGEIAAILSDNSKIGFWRVASNMHANFLGQLEVEDALKIKWVKWAKTDKIRGLLAVVSLTNLKLFLVPNFPATGGDTAAFSLDPLSSLLWTSDSYFFNNLDARIGLSGCIEIITSNNSNTFVHFFVLNVENGGTVSLSQIKVFAYNAPGRRVTDDSDSGNGTCCAFLGKNIFSAGLSNGTILFWDLRDEHGPRDVVITLAGIRRWLVDLVPDKDDLLLAAFQAGAVVSPDSEIQVQPIGGDVRVSQCFGITSVGSRIFTAMSSGVILTMDRSLREKLRRGMTGYVSQWECRRPDAEDTHREGDTLGDKVLQKTMRRADEYFVKIYPKREFPRNLKNLRASDGANNDPSPLHEGTSPVVITCLTSEGGLVAYGLDGGLVHLFTFSD